MRSAQLAGLHVAGVSRRACVIAIQESSNAQIGGHYHRRLSSPARWALRGCQQPTPLFGNTQSLMKVALAPTVPGGGHSERRSVPPSDEHGLTNKP